MNQRKPPPPPPPGRQCNARTRDGDPCKNWGMFPSGRCRMHGGKSWGGDASPRLTHGWYSNYFPYWFYRGEILRQEQLERRLAKSLAELKEQGDWPMPRKRHR